MQTNYIENSYVFFLKIKQLETNSPVFDKFSTAGFYFSYFVADYTYYLFCYGQGDFNELTEIFNHLTIIKKLDKRQRIIRSLRGFFLYVIEIMEDSKDKEIIQTNFDPLFWKEIEKVISQNKKSALSNFLTRNLGVYTETDTEKRRLSQDKLLRIEELEKIYKDLESYKKVTNEENQKLFNNSKKFSMAKESRYPFQNESLDQKNNRNSDLTQNLDRKLPVILEAETEGLELISALFNKLLRIVTIKFLTKDRFLNDFPYHLIYDFILWLIGSNKENPPIWDKELIEILEILSKLKDLQKK